MKRWIIVGVLSLLVFQEALHFNQPVGEVTAHGYWLQEASENPVTTYLWAWIRWICYRLGGVAAAVGVIFGVFGCWVSRAPLIKQGMISAISGFAFVLVVPFVRLVFGSWITWAEEGAFIPTAPTTLLMLPGDLADLAQGLIA